MLKEIIPALPKDRANAKKNLKHRYLPVGIDPGKNTCGVVILHPDEGNDTPLKSFLIDICSFKDADNLVQRTEEIAKQFKLKPIFIIEATNVFWRPLFSYLKRKGYPVHTVCALQTKSSRGTKMGKTKTDLIDAKHIASLYKQGKSHPTTFPEGIRMDLRELVRLHSFLIDIKGRMLTRILKKASRGRFSKDKAIQLKKVAKSSFGIPEGREGFSSCLRIIAQTYRFLEETISKLEDDEIWPLFNQIPNSLKTIKGIGIGAAYILAESRKPEDYENADDVLACFGLDLHIDQSGKHRETGKYISKCGTKYGREAMFLVVERALLHIPQVLAKYRWLRKNKRTDKETKTILAADLVKSCFAIQRDNVPFNPSLIH